MFPLPIEAAPQPLATMKFLSLVRDSLKAALASTEVAWRRAEDMATKPAIAAEKVGIFMVVCCRWSLRKR